MERRTGTPIEKWDDVNGTAPASSGYMELSDDSNVMPMITGDIFQGERFIQLRASKSRPASPCGKRKTRRMNQ